MLQQLKKRKTLKRLERKGGQMSEEFDFFVKTDLSKYKGLYIAIVGRKNHMTGLEIAHMDEETCKIRGEGYLCQFS